METREKIADVLNDLIKINNDRIKGYQTAVEDTSWSDVDLKALFEFYVAQTKKFNRELSEAVAKYAGELPDKGTTTTGKLHRIWIDLKTTITGKDRQSILQECERGEDASKKAYNDALGEAIDFPTEVQQLIRNQADEQLQGHDKIRDLRDNES
ncbi:PA2169 family four-helix-bundle protein [Olivibacter sp. SDN3]|uniref:ferritin-like domain-containing protein n=1 Tax=Olivibacter sp. SDN3 TaxID=2764720 RepID=UPI0016510C7A|nr:PA2169 family four-helix-bundle protein [Olivibacter sp. SDN3]QNL48387.1 PA2169 family four-helix-bundle protein [Olivibacter sp. SDN3]